MCLQLEYEHTDRHDTTVEATTKQESKKCEVFIFSCLHLDYEHTYRHAAERDNRRRRSMHILFYILI